MTLEQGVTAAAPLLTAFLGALAGVPKMRKRLKALEVELGSMRRKLGRISEKMHIEVTNPGIRNPLLGPEERTKP